MTPAPKKQQTQIISNTWARWLMGIAGALAITVSLSYWNLQKTLIQMQERERNRQESVLRIETTVNTVQNDIRAMRDVQLQELKDRVKTIEIELKK
jgi:hypothetical protein